MFVFGLRVCGELWVCGEFAALQVLNVGICVYAGFRMGDVVMVVVVLLVEVLHCVGLGLRVGPFWVTL